MTTSRTAERAPVDKTVDNFSKVWGSGRSRTAAKKFIHMQ